MPDLLDNPFVDAEMEEENRLEDLLDQVRNDQDRLDQLGSSKLRETGQKMDSLRNARSTGKIDGDEFMREMRNVHDDAARFRWKSHVMPHGSRPGDIVVDNGIQKVRNDGGGFDIPELYARLHS